MIAWQIGLIMSPSTMKTNVRLHILFWLAYFVFCFVSDVIVDPSSTLTAEITFFISQNIYLFYALSYFLKKFNAKSKYNILYSAIRLTTILAIFFPIRYFLRYYFLSTFVDPEFGELSIYAWAVNGVLWVLNYFFLAAAHFYFLSSIRQQKMLRELLVEKHKKEFERLELENSLLKAQINPHFLYNSLNLLYSKALPLSTELSDSIMRLSDIMRYSFQSTDSGGFVLLRDELHHIRNIIDMARLRYNHTIFLDIHISNEIENIKVLPMVFVTLVENVLKHGKLNDEAAPAEVRVEFSEEGVLHFFTKNAKRFGPKESTTGIGLKNAIHRLNDFYGKSCNVNVVDSESDFQLSVSIALMEPLILHAHDQLPHN